MAQQSIITEEMAALVRTECARKAGKARLVKMTREERSRIAKLAAQARWHRKSAPPPGPPDPNDPQDKLRRGVGAEAGIMSNSRERKPAASVSEQPELFSDAA